MGYIVKNIEGVTAVLDENEIDKPKEIRFIDSAYHELFRIPDGASIRIYYANDDPRRMKSFVCRYIDDYHVKVGSSVYHIAEFAERMERIKAKYAPAPEKHIIWSNISPDFEAWKEDVKKEIPDLSENELYNRMIEDINAQFYDEKDNLNGEKYDILAIGDIGRWNGRVTGYKEFLNSPIASVLSSECDYCEWYVDECGELRSTQHHHDGTNYILYRKYKDDVTDEQRDCLKDLIYNGKKYDCTLQKYTEPLGLDVAKVYGWHLQSNTKEKEGEAR